MSVKINVNGVEKEVEESDATYSECSALVGYSPEHLPTITYKGPEGWGTVAPGETLSLSEGLVLNIVMTDGS